MWRLSKRGSEASGSRGGGSSTAVEAALRGAKEGNTVTCSRSSAPAAKHLHGQAGQPLVLVVLALKPLPCAEYTEWEKGNRVDKCRLEWVSVDSS